MTANDTWASAWQNQQNGCAPSKDSGQPGHPPSLIRVFAVCMKKAWLPSECTAKTLIGLGGCSGCSEFLLGAHSLCWFCHVAAHLIFSCSHLHTLQGYTCPAEGYISNGHSANLAWALNSDWLKVDFGYMDQWQQIHCTAEGQWTLAFHCTMYLLPLDFVSKIQFSTIRACLTHAEWPLDMYHFAGHVSPCIVGLGDFKTALGCLYEHLNTIEASHEIMVLSILRKLNSSKAHDIWFLVGHSPDPWLVACVISTIICAGSIVGYYNWAIMIYI